MSNRLEGVAHLAGQTLRTVSYAALYRYTTRRSLALGADVDKVQLTRPAPGLFPLVQDVLKLQAKDAKAVADGLYPIPLEESGSFAERIEAVRRMLDDLPKSAERRAGKRFDEAAALPEAEGLPGYYTQNFHYQSGGWLTDDSARLYDIQVETLFMGAAGAMRRQAIPPIAEFVKGRDQRQLRLVDVACGSGRFLGQLAQAFPALPMTGTDLSQAYLDEAARFLSDRRNIGFRQANAETLPFETASFDIATCIYLFHELPRDVRRRVTGEIARILKPGGLFVFVDSIQWGDVDGYDGLLEAFPQRFHEPYFLDYCADDLTGVGGVFADAGFEIWDAFPAFLSKVGVCKKKSAS
ncbi:class I SAM-dependent methyltransferase [Rhodomicrobium lacus]|uniref:class I SAM-dependent methyltransferase n=1 Tax=Rhodomicrobium lacus TaxID=2498452 RepID=UPI0026E22D55|nr:class I SAM-dependent methyltransferase [Rhodomicrobium lacus]WKW51796.1 class I SAM-dependent methyltransferase [Rhodomicrobium lacus]